MNDCTAVLDASALIAAMLVEAGSDAIAPRLVDACISAVNLSEVVAKLSERGVPAAMIEESLADLDIAVIPFDQPQAIRAGALRPATRAAGLSLGDRACLALAAHLGLPAITTDAAWRGVETGAAVEVVRR